MLEFSFNWKQLSAVAGMSLRQIFFRLYPGSVGSDQVIDFLKRLKTQIRGKLLIVWDGLPAHRSLKIKQFLRDQRGHFWMERLPAYTPELNPVEYLWRWWKQHQLANFCPKDFASLSRHARAALRRSQRHPTLIRSCYHQAKLLFADIIT